MRLPWADTHLRESKGEEREKEGRRLLCYQKKQRRKEEDPSTI